MIIEQAVLNVIPAKTAEFEMALQRALPLISTSAGFQGLEIRRHAKVRHQYLLLVRWESLEHHTQGFRKSDRYLKWKDLLHKFYDPFPEVSHFDEVVALV